MRRQRGSETAKGTTDEWSEMMIKKSLCIIEFFIRLLAYTSFDEDNLIVHDWIICEEKSEEIKLPFYTKNSSFLVDEETRKKINKILLSNSILLHFFFYLEYKSNFLRLKIKNYNIICNSRKF